MIIRLNVTFSWVPRLSVDFLFTDQYDGKIEGHLKGGNRFPTNFCI